MENSTNLRTIQNNISQKSFAAPYHFACYLPFKGKVYELDGLQKGPVLVAPIEEGKEWTSAACEEINYRIKALVKQHLQFHIFAVVPDVKEAV